MFVPKYTITNSILKNVGIIDASREVIANAPLIPAWEAKFKKEAIERTVHHGTHIEGNRLTVEEVKDVLDGKDVLGRDRDIQEIINYRNVLKYIDGIASQLIPAQNYYFSLKILLDIHKITTDKILHTDHSGKFRLTQVVIKNASTGQISYTPPPAAEVAYLIEDLINWINDEETRDLHPVIKAGIIHYEVSRIHPFLDGNGRTGRAVATLIMFLDGYDIRKFFSLEEYFDQSPMDYYLTLQAVSNQLVLDTHERDLTPWLEYFVKGVAIELHRVKEKVKRVSTDAHIKNKLGAQVELNERQMMIMEYLHRHGKMQNKDFRKIFPDFSDDTVLREMRLLKKRSLIKKTGGTKKATYILG